MEIKTEVKKKVEKSDEEDIENKCSHGTYKRGNIVQRQKVHEKQLAPSKLESFVDDDDDDAPRTFRIMTTKMNMKKMILFLRA